MASGTQTDRMPVGHGVAEVQQAQQQPPVSEDAAPKQMRKVRRNVASIIWYLCGVMVVLLAFRFVLELLGANPYNGFVHFIYSVSYPLVAPFLGMFGYTVKYGVAWLDLYSAIAAAVYLVVAWGIVKLMYLAR